MSFIKITEQNSLYNDLERKSVRALLEDINTEDQKVALAVRETIPKIEELVLQIVPRMKQGGRIFYLGAGTSGRLGVLDASEIPPTFGMPSTLIVGLIAGGDTALRNPVENAEDDEERGWQELLGLVLLAVANRPGSVPAVHPDVIRSRQRTVPLPMLDISATQIRRRVADGKPIDHLVPPGVARYIADHHLYKDAAAH